MTDETSLDLAVLDPGDAPDVAAKAVRRFRLRVVLFTVACVIVAAVATGAVVAWIVKDRPQTEATGWTRAQTAVLNDFVGICQTPTYVFGELEVGLADAVRIDDADSRFTFCCGDRLQSNVRRPTEPRSGRRRV